DRWYIGRCWRGRWTSDFLPEDADNKVHAAGSDLVSFRLMDAALGNCPVRSCARQVGDHQPSQKHDECQNNNKSRSSLAVRMGLERRSHLRSSSDQNNGCKSEWLTRQLLEPASYRWCGRWSQHFAQLG